MAHQEGSGPTLKSRLAAGNRMRGLLTRVPSLMLADMAGNNGFDFIFLDTEHGLADPAGIQADITAARAAGMPTLVRIGEGEASMALRVLDAGADGIIVPHVRDAQGARRAVATAHYPPVGTRGFATYTTAGRWGKTPPTEHGTQTTERTVVVVMIEDAAGVQNRRDILATPGVDAVFVGPADLAASIGYDGALADRLRQQVWTAAREAKIPVLALASGIDDAQRAWDAGATLVVLNAQAAIDRCLADWIHAT